ncbi:MAG: uracil-DNA glycosylase [Bacteroidota bacterium]|nr:uracil-DNA glycosylase [Bacteroidota bacterium]
MAKIALKLHQSWKTVLKSEFKKNYFAELRSFLEKEYDAAPVYPPRNLIFNAFSYPFSDVKVVILGQDPYHGAGQAHGLCFSVPKDVPVPRSLINIFKELREDVSGFSIPSHGNLEKWAEQGVFLLNTTLTVREGQPLSHHNKGWEIFTDCVIETLSKKRDGLVFLLWGNNARTKESLIDSSKHLILKAAHPSPLSASRGFFGCHHFSQTNEFLKVHIQTPIDWCLE